VTDVVCLGILVADVIGRPVDELPARGSLALMEDVALRGGGCALNTATVLARLGLDTAVAGKIGGDPFGDFLLALLDERGIERSAVVRDPAVATSATIVLVGSDGERTFLHLPGANGVLSAGELDRDLLFGGRVLHVAGALVMDGLDGEPFAELLSEAHRRGVLTSLDTVWDGSGRWDRVLPSLPHVDLFCPSLGEAQAISGEETPEAAAGRLRELGARAVAVTLGADGCYASGEGFDGSVPGFPVGAVDGTGAGDAFTAGLLFGRLAGWELERAARFANACGALATTAVGAVEGLPEGSEVVAPHAPA